MKFKWIVIFSFVGLTLCYLVDYYFFELHPAYAYLIGYGTALYAVVIGMLQGDKET